MLKILGLTDYSSALTLLGEIYTVEVKFVSIWEDSRITNVLCKGGRVSPQVNSEGKLKTRSGTGAGCVYPEAPDTSITKAAP